MEFEGLTVQFAWLQPKVLRWLACTHINGPGSSSLVYIWTLVVHRTGRYKHIGGATRAGAITGTEWTDLSFEACNTGALCTHW